MTDKAPELKPCPFCGGGSEIFNGYVTCVETGCEMCLSDVSDVKFTPNEWNRRADLHVTVKPLEFRDSYGVIRADTPFGSYKIAGKILHLPSGASMVSENPESDANERHRETILAALEPAPITPAQAAEVLGDALDAEPATGVPDDEWYPAVRGWLRAIAEGESDNG